MVLQGEEAAVPDVLQHAVRNFSDLGLIVPVDDPIDGCKMHEIFCVPKNLLIFSSERLVCVFALFYASITW